MEAMCPPICLLQRLFLNTIQYKASLSTFFHIANNSNIKGSLALSSTAFPNSALFTFPINRVIVNLPYSQFDLWFSSTHFQQFPRTMSSSPTSQPRGRYRRRSLSAPVSLNLPDSPTSESSEHAQHHDRVHTSSAASAICARVIELIEELKELNLALLELNSENASNFEQVSASSPTSANHPAILRLPAIGISIVFRDQPSTVDHNEEGIAPQNSPAVDTERNGIINSSQGHRPGTLDPAAATYLAFRGLE